MTFPPPEVNHKTSEPLPEGVVPACVAKKKEPMKGEAREMTPEWKAAVIAKLADNKKHKRSPDSLAELARRVGADKRGFYVTFKTNQTTSKYVDAICAVLEIDPPLVKPTGDEGQIRALSAERQAMLIGFVNGLSEALRTLPVEQQKPIRTLIASFLRDFFADNG